MKFEKKKYFYTTQFSITKLSNFWRKSFIKVTNLLHLNLIETNWVQFQRSFYGIFLDFPSILEVPQNQQIMDVNSWNYLFSINFNFYIKNKKDFRFFKNSPKKITDLLYILRKTNTKYCEYSLQNKLNFFVLGYEKKKPNNSLLYFNKTSFIVLNYWNINFLNLTNFLKTPKYFLFFSFFYSSNLNNLQNFKKNSSFKYIAKNIFYLLNINNICQNYFSITSAKLNEAKLNEAKLNEAKLNEAKLNEAKLNEAKLNEAKLNEAKLNEAKTKYFYKCKPYKLYQFYKKLKKNFYDNIGFIVWFQLFERSNQNTYLLQRPLNFPSQWIQKGDLLADCSASNKGEIALGKNLLVAYMPWEGFNFEDAVLINEKILSKYTSLHIVKYDLEISETANKFEKITPNIPGFSNNDLQKIDKNGIIKIGSWVQEGDILVGKIISTVPQPLLTHEKLLYDIMGQKTPQIEEKCLRVPLGVSGRIIRVSYVYSKKENSSKMQPKVKKKRLSFTKKNSQQIPPKIISKTLLKKISIYIMEKREFQVGDKISGRHGNKGIISKVFANSDMPYLSDGSSLDVILNPLGVPSRMNVGQILECLLGFAGKIFQTKFQVLCFDEIYGYEASRSYIYSKLLDICKKTQQKWIFSKKNPGKLHLFDGRNGYIFQQSVMVGVTYLMKLIHIVDEKIHARATGPYSLITQQPLRGRAKHGGQRIGEMEVWALQGFGCAYTLQELLTVKSDDIHGRKQIMQALLKNTPFKFGTPESFRVVLRELQCLCLDLQLSV